jgi:sigma-B regulation protein RsbU (phosphoserine phosphatase)
VIAIDTKTGVLETVMAGMEPAVILRKDGSTQMLDRMPAPALNVAPQSRFSSANYVLHAGDLLLAFTDGFTEARSKTHTFLGYEGLLEIMQQAHRENNLLKNIGGHILASVRQFAAGALHDDACLLLAQLT